MSYLIINFSVAEGCMKPKCIFIFQHYSYRTPSPGLMLREYNKSATDISRIYTYSYLTEEPSMGYLRKPIDPYDKAPTSPHFHRPTCKFQTVLSLTQFYLQLMVF